MMQYDDLKMLLSFFNEVLKYNMQNIKMWP